MDTFHKGQLTGSSDDLYIIMHKIKCIIMLQLPIPYLNIPHEPRHTNICFPLDMYQKGCGLRLLSFSPNSPRADIGNGYSSQTAV